MRLSAVASVAGFPCILAVNFDGAPAGSFDVAPQVAFDLHLTLPVGPHSLGFSCEGADETRPFAVNVIRLSADTAPSSPAASVSLVDQLPGWSTPAPGDTVRVAALVGRDQRTAPAEVTVHNEGGSARQDLYAVRTPSEGTAPPSDGTSAASAIQAGRRVSARVLLRNHGSESASVTLAVWSLCTVPTNENVNAIVTRDWRYVRVTVTSKGCPMRVELYPHPPKGRLATFEVAPLVVSIDD